jgi:hypothetical protein
MCQDCTTTPPTFQLASLVEFSLELPYRFPFPLILQTPHPFRPESVLASCMRTGASTLHSLSQLMSSNGANLIGTLQNRCKPYCYFAKYLLELLAIRRFVVAHLLSLSHGIL